MEKPGLGVQPQVASPREPDPLVKCDLWRSSSSPPAYPGPRPGVTRSPEPRLGAQGDNWAAFLKNVTRRPTTASAPVGGASAASGHPPSHRPGQSGGPTPFSTGPPRTSGETSIDRSALIGPFNHRTRTHVAQAEVLELLSSLSLTHLFVDFPGAPPTNESIQIKLTSWDAVQDIISVFKERTLTTLHAAGPLWAIRCRSKEERARTGPVSRLVRLLNLWREQQCASFKIEGHYTRGQESTWISWSRFETEQCILYRGPHSGVWHIDSNIFAAVGLPGTAAEWLANLL